MEIQMKRQTLVDESEFLDAIDAPQMKGTYIMVAKKFAKGIEIQLNFAEKVLNLSQEKITIDYFAEIINKLYDIKLNEEDYYKIFSLAYNKEFTPRRTDLIRTYMVRNIYKFNESYSLYSKDVETEFKIAYAEDFIHNANNRYTIKELRQLIKDRKIIILDEFDEEITIPERLQESYEKFTVYKNYKDMNEDNPFYNYILAYLRGALTNEKIKKGLHEYLINLQLIINEILSNISTKSFLTNLAKECQKEFEKLNILQRLESLITRSLELTETEKYEKRTTEIISKPLPVEEKTGKYIRRKSRRKNHK